MPAENKRKLTHFIKLMQQYIARLMALQPSGILDPDLALENRINAVATSMAWHSPFSSRGPDLSLIVFHPETADGSRSDLFELAYEGERADVARFRGWHHYMVHQMIPRVSAWIIKAENAIHELEREAGKATEGTKSKKHLTLAQVRTRVERIVKAGGGKWPGYSTLEAKGFARGTLQKLTMESGSYLSARFAESKRPLGKNPKAVMLSEKVKAGAGNNDAELQRLIRDSNADKASEERHPKVFKRV